MRRIVAGTYLSTEKEEEEEEKEEEEGENHGLADFRIDR